jgi:hypothetical protein
VRGEAFYKWVCSMREGGRWLAVRKERKTREGKEDAYERQVLQRMGTGVGAGRRRVGKMRRVTELNEEVRESTSVRIGQSGEAGKRSIRTHCPLL